MPLFRKLFLTNRVQDHVDASFEVYIPTLLQSKDTPTQSHRLTLALWLSLMRTLPDSLARKAVTALAKYTVVLGLGI